MMDREWWRVNHSPCDWWEGYPGMPFSLFLANYNEAPVWKEGFFSFPCHGPRFFSWEIVNKDRFLSGDYCPLKPEVLCWGMAYSEAIQLGRRAEPMTDQELLTRTARCLENDKQCQPEVGK